MLSCNKKKDRSRRPKLKPSNWPRKPMLRKFKRRRSREGSLNSRRLRLRRSRRQKSYKGRRCRKRSKRRKSCRRSKLKKMPK